jgi:L-serine dehydratase
MQSIREIFKIGLGPSSSHTLGPARAAEIFTRGNAGAIKFKVTLYGSLAATGKGHQTDLALQKALAPKTVEIIWKANEILPLHPNGMIFEALDGSGATLDSWEVYSVGGGDLKDRSGKFTGPTVYEHGNMEEILAWCKSEGRTFWEYVEEREGKSIWPFLEEVWKAMKDAVKRGLENEGSLPGPLHLQRKAPSYYIKAMNSKGTTHNKGLLFAYALAVSEENAAGGTVVTGPTCGSSGVLPSVLYYLRTEEHFTDPKIIKALATAGLIANLVKTNASISGAEVGCQGEIGTACAMAAAGAAQCMGGSINQIEYAAEMGFEHNLGLTCDPVGGYVQIPCIERNAIAAGKAVECAVYALFSDGGHKISFDKVVETMARTGRDLQSQYRETGVGGLALGWKPFEKKG